MTAADSGVAGWLLRVAMFSWASWQTAQVTRNKRHQPGWGRGEVAAERRLEYGQAGRQTPAALAHPLHDFVNCHALVPASFLGFP